MKRLVLLLALVSLACRAGAQTTRTFRSLEARISEARSVVRGTVSELARTVIVPRMGASPDGTTWPDGIVEYRITVRVEEVLKGPRRSRAPLVRQTSDYDKRFEGWRDARTSFLWFIGSADAAPSASWDALRVGSSVAAERGYVTDAPPLFSMDFHVLRDPRIILDRARAFSRQRPAGDRLHKFTISRNMAQRCSPSADANYLIVPVDASLERVARRLVREPGASLAGDLDATPDPRILDELRMAGVESLRYFRSAANRKILESLLSDRTQDALGRRAGEILREWNEGDRPR